MKETLDQILADGVVAGAAPGCVATWPHRLGDADVP